MTRNECPKCGSCGDDVYKYGENFEGEFFECQDCGLDFQRKWDGKIKVSEGAR